MKKMKFKLLLLPLLLLISNFALGGWQGKIEYTQDLHMAKSDGTPNNEFSTGVVYVEYLARAQVLNSSLIGFGSTV